MTKTVALVPLRGGSKSISKKNIKPLAGKPLCSWVLKTATDAKVFDQIYVSTDSDEIVSVVNDLQLGINLIMRPRELATDTASTESVMLHFMEEVDFDILATIQATSPLVRVEDFVRALQKFETEQLDSLLTGVRLRRFFWSPEGEPLNYNPQKRPLRQNFDGSIMENGAFYLTRRAVLEKYRSRLGGIIGVYEMDKDTAVELDEPGDWPIVEALLRKRNKDSLAEKLGKIKLLAMDCDGVLTDGGMYYSENGDELKKFNTRDGQGLALLQAKGIKTAIITGEESEAVKRRTQKLKIDDLFTGVKDKAVPMRVLISKYNLKLEEVAYIGDDINDIPAMESAGIAFAVYDSVSLVKERADFILSKAGGQGAVREACANILGE